MGSFNQFFTAKMMSPIETVIRSTGSGNYLSKCGGLALYYHLKLSS